MSGYLLAPHLAADLIHDLEALEGGLRRERLLTDELKLQRDALALDVERFRFRLEEEELLRAHLEEEVEELRERPTATDVVLYMGSAGLVVGVVGFVVGLLAF